ncbi:MAG: PIG-L family deacetylase [Solirubrobacterales bacterium]|nr:PIG-L family deacetylase [Solirubrobacterales bacterium]
MSGRGGLLVVTSHPDDEVLIAGGTLAACASAGLPTAVVCLTRGEQGPICDPARATRANLGEVRMNELRNACAKLGVQWVRCYRRQDGNLPWSDRSAMVAQLTRVLNARRPDAVVTFGEDGLYYHPDHIATYEFTLRAVERAAEPPAMYRSVWPDDLMEDLVDELSRRELPTDLWDLEPREFGVGSEDRVGEIVLDVRPHAIRKLAALRCHRTQVGPGHAFAALPADLAVRFLGIERFVPVDPSRDSGWLMSAVGGKAAARV